jgi:hypothetical protein
MDVDTAVLRRCAASDGTFVVGVSDLAAATAGSAATSIEKTPLVRHAACLVLLHVTSASAAKVKPRLKQVIRPMRRPYRRRGRPTMTKTSVRR